MNLKPTNVPLTAKEFDTAVCGLCAGCGCGCGYILYLRDSVPVDLYGHPEDENGIGSLCTKGITLIQEATRNPLRLREPFIRKGTDFERLTPAEVSSWIRENLKGKVGVFLDRYTDLRDYALARSMGWEIYSDSIYLPFKASTLKPREWRERRVILSFECDPVFSEVMATRWLVDAFERSAYIFSVSTRLGTMGTKSTESLLLKPPLVVKFLEELAGAVEEGKSPAIFGEKVKKLAELLHTAYDSLILVGEALLRTRWKGNVLHALRRIRKKLPVDYSIVGNVSPLPAKDVKDLKEDFRELEALVLFGNPALYMSEEELKELTKKKVVSITPFPNLTAHHSTLVLPSLLFPEREFTAFRNGFGALFQSPQTLPRPEGIVELAEILGVKTEPEKIPKLPTIEEVEGVWEIEPVETEGIYLVCDNTLVDDVGHWNVWTHEIEREQFAYMSEETAGSLSAKDEIVLKGISLKVRLDNNIARDVVFVPNSFEEMHPFDPGVRVGRLMREAYLRVERLK